MGGISRRSWKGEDLGAHFRGADLGMEFGQGFGIRC